MPASTTSWNRAASAGLAPPKSAPTKAPGSVTRPVERVWSRLGRRDSRTAVRPMPRWARDGRRAQREPGLDLVAVLGGPLRRKLRPDSVAAVIALPMMMPPTATTYRTLRATSRSAKTSTRETPAPLHLRRRPAARRPGASARHRTTRGGPGGRGEHQQDERRHGPGDGQDAAQQQGHDRETESCPGQGPERGPAQPRPLPSGEGPTVTPTRTSSPDGEPPVVQPPTTRCRR